MFNVSKSPNVSAEPSTFVRGKWKKYKFGLIKFCPSKLNSEMHAIIPIQGIPASVDFHASRMRQLRQLALVRKILAASQETVWPERKQCSARADLCECLCSTAFWCSLRRVENLNLNLTTIGQRFSNTPLVRNRVMRVDF